MSNYEKHRTLKQVNGIRKTRSILWLAGMNSFPAHFLRVGCVITQWRKTALLHCGVTNVGKHPGIREHSKKYEVHHEHQTGRDTDEIAPLFLEGYRVHLGAVNKVKVNGREV